MGQTVFNGNVAASGTATVRLSTGDAESLLVAWTITDSGATGDIGATTVKPYTPTDNPNRTENVSTVLEAVLPAVNVSAATRTGTVTTRLDRYDVRGLDDVQLKLTNAAGATRDVEVHVYLYG